MKALPDAAFAASGVSNCAPGQGTDGQDLPAQWNILEGDSGVCQKGMTWG